MSRGYRAEFGLEQQQQLLKAVRRGIHTIIRNIRVYTALGSYVNDPVFQLKK